MDEVFEGMLTRLWSREGGLSNLENDRGGITKYGITRVALAEYKGVHISKVSEDDVRKLPLSLANLVYEKNYWQRPRFDVIASETPALRPIAEFIFDWGVNSGTGTAARKVQDFIGATPDGIFGPKSRAALQEEWKRHGTVALLNHLCDYRLRYYGRICQSDKSQIKFIVGWMRRIESLRYLATTVTW